MTKRKILTVIALFVAVTTLSGCVVPMVNKNNSAQQTNSTNSSVTTKNTQSDSPEETEAPEKSVLSLGDTITLNEWEITVNSADTTEQIENSAYTAFTPDEGNVYITINVTAKNIDTNSATFLPSFSMGKDIKAKLVYGEYEFSATNLIGYSEDLHNTTLNPLSSKTGIITFSITKEIANLNSLYFVLYNNKETYTFSLA